MRLAVLVPAPDFAEEWRWAFDAEARALIDAGAEVDAVPWTQAEDLSAYDLVLPLVAWGYCERAPEWFAFLDRLERDRVPVVNPVPLLRWSSDKAYLAELGRGDVPTVPSIAVEQLDQLAIEQARTRFQAERLIVKPRISAGAFQTYLLEPGQPLPSDVIGSAMLIQPYIPTIATSGEYSLILFDGVVSHSVVKRPKAGDFRVQPHLGGTTEQCAVPPGGKALALAALAAAPARATYARVDMIADELGTLRIMELELVEPALFLDVAPDGEAAFAKAILSAASASGE